jgi:subtilisin
VAVSREAGGLHMRKLGLLVVAGLVATLLLAATASASADGTPVPGRYIVIVADSSAGEVTGAALARIHARLPGVTVTHTYDHALHGYAAELSDAALARVQADARVARVVQDRYAIAIEAQTLPTGIDRIDADLGPQLSGDGTGTAPGDVAVMDTGIRRRELPRHDDRPRRHDWRPARPRHPRGGDPRR